jgi:hypothetical protein
LFFFLFIEAARHLFGPFAFPSCLPGHYKRKSVLIDHSEE